MKVSYQPCKASSRRLESPFSWGFLWVLLLALELLLPICSGDCDDPPRYNSMKIKGTANPPYNVGSQIEYECRPGYKTIAPPLPFSAVCQADDTWTPLQEACTKKTCRHLGDLVNGEIIYGGGTMEFGSQAQFRCNEGYYLLGPKVVYCEVSGNTVEWSDNLPACERVLCKPPPTIPNGEFTNSQKVTFEYNEVVTYRCKPSGGPDEYSLVGERQLICTGQDQWSSGPPECKVVKCDYPVVQNGRIVSGYGKKFLYNAAVKFECNAGFSLEGGDTIICGADSTWNPKIPKCIQGAASKSTTTKRTTSSSSGAASKSSTTKRTTSTSSGVKPTVSTTSTHKTTGYPTFEDETPAKGSNLDGGLIAVIILTVLLATTVIGTCTYKFLRIRKRH